MDIIFIIGIAIGFILGCFFTFVISRMVKKQVYEGMMKAMDDCKNPKKKLETHGEYDENDPVNFWKPKGWKPE